MISGSNRQSVVDMPGTPETLGYSRILSVIAFLIAMLIALAMAQPGLSKSEVLPPAIVTSAYSLYSFFYCGRRTVNASSVASYGVVMFIGFPAIYGALDLYQSNKSYTARSLIIVLILAFVFQCILILLSKDSRSSGECHGIFRNTTETSAALSMIFRLSIVMFLSFLLTKLLGAGIASAGFAWIAVLGGAVVFFWSSEKRARLCGAILVVVTFALETGLALGSFGRLNLAVLALSLMVIASLRLRSWIPKIVMAAVTGPILVYLANQRVEYLQSERGTALVSETEGLGSVVGPFHSAGSIVDAVVQGRINLAWGESLFNAAVTGVPRSIWPEKPVGFGREIVEVTQPWLASNQGFSDAGTFIGEAVWNFGILFAPLYLVSFALMVRILDRTIQSVFDKSPDRAPFILLMLVSMASGTLLNVIWGSASTAAARTMFPLAVLLLLWIYSTHVSTSKSRQ